MATVNGCGPAVAARLKHARSRPSLLGNGHEAPRRAELQGVGGHARARTSRSRGRGSTAVARERLAAGASLEFVSRHEFRVTGLPTAGAGKIDDPAAKRGGPGQQALEERPQARQGKRFTRQGQPDAGFRQGHGDEVEVQGQGTAGS